MAADAATPRNHRDGTGATDWDSFDPPADGGRPRADAVISQGGCDLPEILVVEGRLDGADVVYDDERVLSVRLP